MSNPCSIKSCGCPPREKVFGVTMNKGIAAKITDPAKFLSWSWWVYLTPSFASTVFSRPWIHVNVLLNLVLGNMTFYLAYGGLHSPNVAISHSLIVRLLVFVLANYAGNLVNIYHIGTRKKAADLIRSMSMVVDTLSVSLDYENPRAAELLTTLYGAVNAMGHYAFAHASSNTKYRLSKKEMTALFEDRGFDAQYLLSFHKKQTVSVLRLGLLQTLQQERTRDDGCLGRLDFIQWSALQRDLHAMSGGTMSVMSCVSSNKLPFCYTQLVNWGTRMTLLFYTLFVYGHAAEETRELGLVMPFACITFFWYNTEPPYCSTKNYIMFNAAHIIGVYFVLGFLELYPCLYKIWESGLVLRNYLNIVDLVCQPLLPATCCSQPIKDLDMLKSKRGSSSGDCANGS